MTFVSTTSARRNSHLVPAALALALTGLLSPLHINLLGQTWPLVWLPFAVVALWPRQASAVPSAVLLFIGGLWVDVATLGAPGQWPLVFLATYSILRPDWAEPGRGVLRGILRVIQALAVGVPVLLLSGWAVWGGWPDWAALGRGVAVLWVALPFLIVLRDLLGHRMSRDDY